MAKLFNKLPNSVGNFVSAAYFRSTTLMSGNRGNHSLSVVNSHQNMRVKILSALTDNYMYLLIDDATGEAGIIDPVDPDKVVRSVAEEKVKLTSVLTTHHHWDHAGGNEKLAKLVPDLRIYGGDDRIGGLTNKTMDGDTFRVGGLNVRSLHTPCHTTGHICYFVTGSTCSPVVFTGDTLFLGGCGRFFEGDAIQMNEALNSKLASLPDETSVYCGHEYTIQNLTFGLHVEPENEDLKTKLEWAKKMRHLDTPKPTVPSTIGEEKKINPFMRLTAPSVVKFCGQDTPIKTMHFLRSTKDNFKAKT